MPPVLLSATELADRLDVSYESILAWARKGKIPSIRDGRNRLIFNLDAVLNAIRAADPATRIGTEEQAPQEWDEDTVQQIYSE